MIFKVHPPKAFCDSMILNLFPSRSLSAHCSNQEWIFLSLSPPCLHPHFFSACFLPVPLWGLSWVLGYLLRPTPHTTPKKVIENPTSLCWWGIKVSFVLPCTRGCAGAITAETPAPPAVLPSPSVVPLNTRQFSSESSGRPDLRKCSSVIKWVFNYLAINLVIQ